MKRVYLILTVGLLGLFASITNSQAQVRTSGNYRIPYANGLLVTALVDHVTHTLTNRVDLQGIDPATSNYVIVAVEEGTIRKVRDAFSGVNFVWIEHPNGEWSGYFYMRAGSVLARNLFPGDHVTNGQPIGVEGNVGSQLGVNRLRFEMGVPTDADDPINVGNGQLIGEYRLPVICNIPDNTLRVGLPYDPRACFAQEFSHGIYRLPYTNGVTVTFNRDHMSHAPLKTELDLKGSGGPSTNYAVVAAAAGTIMMIVDDNTQTCTFTSSCGNFNNYVWIAHANGEWSKYTHLKTDSVRGKAKRKEGDFVNAGDYIGDEGNIGFSFGPHLHFEIGFPYDGTNSIQINGGFITNGPNRIPLFCNIPGKVGFNGDNFVAGPCSGGNCTPDILLGAATIRETRAYVADDTVDSNNSSIRVDTYGSLALMAGNKITLRPGFHATFNSYVRASIRPCNAPP